MSDQVNSEPLFKTISEIAELEGVSKVAISKRVKKLERSGLEVKRNDRGHVIGVAFAHYEDLRGALDNPNKVAAGRTKSKKAEPASGKSLELDPNSLEAIKREDAKLELDRKRRREMREAGELVLAADVEKHMSEAGRKVQSAVKRLSHHADDLMLEAEKGVHATRLKLDDIATGMLAEISKTFQARADQAPDHDPPKSNDDD